MTTTLAPDAETIGKAKTIARHLPVGELRLEGVDTPIPSPLADLFRSLLSMAAAGEGIVIVGQGQDMAAEAAAEFLNVSPGFVVKLMDDGALPFRILGSQRRIPSMALAVHRARQDEISRQAMDELATLNRDMGLYDDDAPPPTIAADGSPSRDK